MAALARIMCLAHVFGSETRRQFSSPDNLRMLLFARGTPRGRGMSLKFRVAEVDGTVSGGHLSRLAYDRLGGTATVFSDVGMIDTMAVASSARRRGIGRALVKDAEKGLRAGGARTVYAESTPAAVPFYRACGYRVEGEETRAITFFPRQGKRLYTHARDTEPATRLVWKSLTGARWSSTRYARPDGTGVAVRGVIPGDGRRALPWPVFS